ncbi:GNAT family N-acetyltransferase [Pseudooceanicola nanhaiensis]|uniref:GNAT family N-acetyltransferase n=1 Tax=Pseudooceanicola nanhaiensis TaxID=375761 RepID=UPI001CD5BEDC|nr:GNAT family N-acetyltransferase [Pseudooceanicola nanhaiensis]MCA0920821.1 GNAT family N-acetyltransferase [Pseudooceanicola nanhaiensis]
MLFRTSRLRLWWQSPGSHEAKQDPGATRGQTMCAEATKLIETFELTPKRLEDADLPLLHELSVGVRWPHRAEDLRLLMEMGEGLIACDPIGRIVGSAMWFPMGTFANIGMVITSPKLQARGTGQWLVEQAIAACGLESYRLNATRAAYRLYISMGFEPVATVHQRQGIVTAPPAVAPVQGQVRPAGAEDLAAIIALDTAANGAPRAELMARLMELGPALVLETAGEVIGAAFRRRAGRGQVIGPVIAPDEDAAMALTAPHLAALEGRFARLDTMRTGARFIDLLEGSGLAPFDTVTHMTLGPVVPRSGAVQHWGLVNQPLG